MEIRDEERLRLIEENVRDYALLTLSTDGNILTWNTGAEHIFGYTEQEVIGKPFALIFTPEDQAQGVPEAELRRAAETGRAEDERRQVRKDGSYLWGTGVLTALRNETDALRGYFKVVRDISERQERKRLEEVEAESRRRLAQLQTIYAGAPAGLCFLDTALRYVNINDYLARINGRPAADHIGKTVREMIPEFADHFEPLLRRVLATGEPLIDYEVQAPSAAEPDVERDWVLNYYPVKGEGGEIFGINGVVTDITQRKRLEEQLRHAQKMEGIGRLAGGIAHDFNNLLSVILGYAELVEMELPEAAGGRDGLRHIQSAAHRAAGLTRQLLAFARRQAIQPQVVDINRLLSGMETTLRPLVGERVELILRARAAQPAVKVDPSQIEQVVVNLVVNACDAMPDGGKLILETQNLTPADTNLGTDVYVAPGRYVTLVVSDTGIGMTEVVKARLFEPFFTTKTVGKGTGLGLATCYGIVKQNQGYIWVYSEVGLGTTVKVYLPAAVGAAAPKQKRRVTLTPHGGETVLVVEDEPLVRELAVNTLRRHGYTVLEADNGVEALETARQHTGVIHLLLTDMIMPQMGGRELAQRLRAERPETRVLFASGYSEEVLTASEETQAGMPLIQKPFSSRMLLTQVRQTLNADPPE